LLISDGAQEHHKGSSIDILLKLMCGLQGGGISFDRCLVNLRKYKFGHADRIAL
jgi:hypothetical protein